MSRSRPAKPAGPGPMPAPASRRVPGEGILSERTVISMRFWKGLLVSLVVVGLAGCSGGASGPSAVPTPTITATASSVPSASAHMKAWPVRQPGSSTACTRRVSTRPCGTCWPRPRSVRSRGKPGSACTRHAPAAGAGKSRVIKAVTVFGNAAIVAETVAGALPGTAEDVFNYADGRWRYSPQDPSIYQHKSVTADIAAAKAAGLCTSSKVF